MYHIIYKTTNLLNSNYYIGRHSTKNVFDGYMGSGTYFRKELAKHGKENFSREVLFVFETKQESIDKEAEIVCWEVLNDELCYNLILGGNSGFQTTEAKKALFTKKVSGIGFNPMNPPYYVKPVNYSDQYEYTIKPHKQYAYDHKSNLTKGPFIDGIYKALFDKTVWNWISDMYNSQQHHELSEKYIKLMERFDVYKYTIGIYRKERAA